MIQLAIIMAGCRMCEKRSCYLVSSQNWMEMTMIGLLETESLIQLTIEYITIG